MSSKEKPLTDDVEILDDSEAGGVFELSPVDKEAFFRSIQMVKGNKKGIPVTIEDVRPVKEKTIQGEKKHVFSLKLNPHQPFNAYGKPVITEQVQNDEGELVDKQVYQKNEMGEAMFIKLKKYDKPVYISFAFKKTRIKPIEPSEEYPEGKTTQYVVNALSSAFPLLNYLLIGAGKLKEGNKKPFSIGQKSLNELEGLEFLANCELVRIKGLKPFWRLTASDLDFDFGDEEEETENSENSEKKSKSKKKDETEESDDFEDEDDF